MRPTVFSGTGRKGTDLDLGLNAAIVIVERQVAALGAKAAALRREQIAITKRNILNIYLKVHFNDFVCRRM